MRRDWNSGAPTVSRCSGSVRRAVHDVRPAGTVAAYALATGMTYEQKSVVTIGVCTRNGGPALASFLAMPHAPRGVITMSVLAVLLGAIISGFTAAAMLKRFLAPMAQQPALLIS